MIDCQAADVLRETSPARIFARPTAEDLWLGPTRESVLSHLSSPSATRVLLGPRSSGRTCLLRAISERISINATTLRISGPQTDPFRVLNAVVRSAGLQRQALTRIDARAMLSGFIADRLGENRRVVIEVDDADMLTAPAWEIIAELAVGGDNGQPELLLSLVHIDEGGSPAADYIRQEFSPSLGVLSWLEPHEVSQYLRWRLDRYNLAGIITPDATRLIAEASRGSFAAIDHICQIALLTLRGRNEIELNVSIVRKALRHIQRRIQTGDEAYARDGWLIVTEAGRVVCEVPLADRTLIGRSEMNDLHLGNPCLSRHHASIVRKGNSYFLNDLNSVNGTFLNGQPVQYSPVKDGDLLALGPYRIKVRLPEQPSGAELDEIAAGFAETQVMPTPQNVKPARLKIVK